MHMSVEENEMKWKLFAQIADKSIPSLKRQLDINLAQTLELASSPCVTPTFLVSGPFTMRSSRKVKKFSCFKTTLLAFT